MNINLKRAFAAAALVVAGSVATAAVADDRLINQTDSSHIVTLAENAQTDTLQSVLARASDATPAKIRYNNWFLNEVFTGISQLYVEDVSVEEVKRLALEGVQKLQASSPTFTIDDYVEAALDGVLKTLDPHSDYMTADEWRQMVDRTNGEFVGIGVQIGYDNDRQLVRILGTMEDAPAEQAGVRAGDLVTHINGESVQGKTVQEVSDLMKGEEGSTVNITLERPGVADPVQVMITRAVIESSPVTFEAIGDIGYIQITSFNDLTTAKLEDAVAELQRAIGEENIKGYVLDLRFNPGGLLREAISVVDSFIDSGAIVSTGDANGVMEESATAQPGDITNGAPLVVLVNGGSASASEIVAGALQDHDRATVMGTQTFGKGSVQSILPLGRYFPGRGDALRITTQLYYTPSGDTIQNKGVTPDVRTEFQGTASDGRINVREADLNGVIANPNLVQDTHRTTNSCDASGVTPDLETLHDRLVLKLRDGSREADMQLLCAIEKLKDSPEFTTIRPLDMAPVEPAAPALRP